MKLSINKIGIIIAVALLVICSFASYQSFQNGQHIAARAADRDRQYARMVQDDNKILDQCKISPRKPG